MGILPLQFLEGQNAKFLGVTGKEEITIGIPEDVQPGQTLDVKVGFDSNFTFIICLK